MAKPSGKAKRTCLYFFTSEDPVTSQDNFIAGQAIFQWENHRKYFTSLCRRHQGSWERLWGLCGFTSLSYAVTLRGPSRILGGRLVPAGKCLGVRGGTWDSAKPSSNPEGLASPWTIPCPRAPLPPKNFWGETSQDRNVISTYIPVMPVFSNNPIIPSCSRHWSQ